MTKGRIRKLGVILFVAFLAICAVVVFTMLDAESDDSIDGDNSLSTPTPVDPKKEASRLSQVTTNEIIADLKPKVRGPAASRPAELQESKFAKVTILDQFKNAFGNGFVYLPGKRTARRFRLNADGTCRLPVGESPTAIVVKREASPPILIENVRVERGCQIEVQSAICFVGRVTTDGMPPTRRTRIVLLLESPLKWQKINREWNFSRRQGDSLVTIVETADELGNIEVKGLAGTNYEAWVNGYSGYFSGEEGKGAKHVYAQTGVVFRIDLRVAQTVVGVLRYEDDSSPVKNANIEMCWVRRVTDSHKEAFLDKKRSDAAGRFVMTAPTDFNDPIRILLTITHEKGRFQFEVPVDLVVENETDVGEIMIPSSKDESIKIVNVEGAIVEGAIMAVDQTSFLGPSGSNGDLAFEVPAYGRCDLEIAAVGYAAARISRMDETRSLPSRVRLHKCASIEVKGGSEFSLEIESKNGHLFASPKGRYSELHARLWSSQAFAFRTTAKNGVAAFHSTDGVVRIDGLKFPNDVTLTLVQSNAVGSSPMRELSLIEGSVVELSVDDFSAIAPRKTLRLRIVDESGNALPQATMVVSRGGQIGDLVVKSNNKGIVELSVQVGVQIVATVQAIGYQKRRIEMRADSVGEAPTDITLRRSKGR